MTCKNCESLEQRISWLEGLLIKSIEKQWNEKTFYFPDGLGRWNGPNIAFYRQKSFVNSRPEAIKKLSQQPHDNNGDENSHEGHQ